MMASRRESATEGVRPQTHPALPGQWTRVRGEMKIQSLDALGRNGFKMATKSKTGGQKLLEEKARIVSDDSS